MTIPTLTFFNNKGGVGKTSLTYHLAWMYRDLGRRVLLVDLDPQANLTTALLDEETLADIYQPGSMRTVYDAISPLLRGVGDIEVPYVHLITERLSLLVGDLALGRFEDELAAQWPRCVDGNERAFRVLSAFWRLIQRAGEALSAEIALIDVGPNLGAINRAALLASDHLVVPLMADLFSLQGLRNLGPTLRDWRRQWAERRARNPDPKLPLPGGQVSPVGYLVVQHAVRLDRPVKAYERWAEQIPPTYARHVLDPPSDASGTFASDPNCLGLLKHYRSLMPLAQEARKPIFHLRAADGALGSHAQSVRQASAEFRDIALRIAARSWDPPPPAG